MWSFFHIWLGLDHSKEISRKKLHKSIKSNSNLGDFLFNFCTTQKTIFIIFNINKKSINILITCYEIVTPISFQLSTYFENVKLKT